MSETGATAGRQNSTTPNASRSGAAENESSNPSALARTMKQLRGNPLVVVLIAAAALSPLWLLYLCGLAAPVPCALQQPERSGWWTEYFGA